MTTPACALYSILPATREYDGHSSIAFTIGFNTDSSGPRRPATRARISIKRSRPDQCDLRRHGEHASGLPDLLQSLGLDVGRQAIIRRDADIAGELQDLARLVRRAMHRAPPEGPAP
jgi:hypothetical protein